MYENKFDETMDEVSVANGVNWDDDSKICLFARFLGEEADPLTFERYENFLERQAQDELVGDDEDEDENTVELNDGGCLELDDSDGSIR